MSAVIEDSTPVLRPVPLAAGAGSRTIAFDANGSIPLERFLGQVRALAALLPDGQHAINLCEDRYHFMLAFCAVALRGQVTLLPSSRAPGDIAEVASRHPDCYCLGDCAIAPTPPRYWRLPDTLVEMAGEPPNTGLGALVAIGFTSGSTGAPTANNKHWGSLCTSTSQNLAALRDLWPVGDTAQIVATVPPQHMYGMELSVLLPLLGDVAVHTGRPFFPHDILQALAEVPAPRLLVTTPVHLRALLDTCNADATLVRPALAGIISATAVMPPGLAADAEALFDCELRELFGSTETCVIAHRRSARDRAWTPFPGVQVQPQPDGCLVLAPHLVAPVALADLVELHDDGRFELRGRNADLLEIAGKRASLADLTRKLQAVPGVIDGVVFQLDDSAGASGVRRIAALAVAPGHEPAAILAALRRNIDPVFLPRPLRCVPALPHNATGKLPRDALLALLRGVSR